MKHLTLEEFQELVERRAKLTWKVLVKKGKEYATTDRAMDSFHEQADMSMHSEPTSVAWELMVKHLYSVRRMISEYEETGQLPTDYMLDEKIGDAINYLILIEALFREAKSVTPNPGVEYSYTITNEKQ